MAAMRLSFCGHRKSGAFLSNERCGCGDRLIPAGAVAAQTRFENRQVGLDSRKFVDLAWLVSSSFWSCLWRRNHSSESQNLDFSPPSEFLVGTGVFRRQKLALDNIDSHSYDSHNKTSNGWP